MADAATVTRLRGLALPAVKGPGGYFETKKDLDVAWGDLMVALFTPRATRVMNRSFGSVLHEQLFEPNTSEQDATIRYVIQEAIGENCPHIQFREVRISREESRATVRIFFALRTDTSDVQSREVIVEKSHLSAFLV